MAEPSDLVGATIVGVELDCDDNRCTFALADGRRVVAEAMGNCRLEEWWLSVRVDGP